jgi:hypothetical protein
MRYKLLSVISLVALLCAATATYALEKAKIKLANARQKGQTVSVTLSSSKPLRVGGNRYVLHIGAKDFVRSQQTKSKGKGTISFLIPINEFNKLNDGEVMYMSYGNLMSEGELPTEQQLTELTNSPTEQCWSLGKFSKKILNK